MVARLGKKLVESGFTSVAKRRKNLAYPTKLDAKLDKLKTDISSKEKRLKELLEKELISKNKYQTLLDTYKEPRQKKINKLQNQIAARAKEMERTGKVQTTRNNPRLAAEKERMNLRTAKKGGKLRGMGKALRGGGKVTRG